jgi:hypothetical protein
MEQPEKSGGRDTGRKVFLPDHKDAYPIPEKFRLPFHGHMLTPTAVPSASERRLHIDLLEKRRRQRAILIGLAVLELPIFALTMLRPSPAIFPAALGAAVALALGAALLLIMGPRRREGGGR